MAFVVQDLFGIGFTRSMGQILRADGLAGAGWQATIVGNEDGSTFKVVDADDGVGIFRVAATANPPGFSPFGDLVVFQSHPATAIQGAAIAQNPLTTGNVNEGILFMWVTFPAFPGSRAALVYVTPPNETDVLLYVDQSELTLLRKNPFFP